MSDTLQFVEIAREKSLTEEDAVSVTTSTVDHDKLKCVGHLEPAEKTGTHSHLKISTLTVETSEVNLNTAIVGGDKQ